MNGFVALSLLAVVRNVSAGVPNVGITICNEANPCDIHSDTLARNASAPKAAITKKVQGGPPKRAGHRDASEISSGEKEQLGSNLPQHYVGVSWDGFAATERTLQVRQAEPVKVIDLRAGDVIHAVVEHELEVWPNVEAPVRAVIIRGKYKGAYLLGDARLDPARKRALIDFSRIRTFGLVGDRSLSIKGIATDEEGRLGLGGNYHSESGKFFFAEVLASAATGFTDATIQRQQNAIGNWVQEPSVANAGKAGLANALAKRSERWAQQEAQAPEWTELGAFREIRVVLKQDPTEVTK